jgi:hypothetical protein
MSSKMYRAFFFITTHTDMRGRQGNLGGATQSGTTRARARTHTHTHTHTDMEGRQALWEAPADGRVQAHRDKAIVDNFLDHERVFQYMKPFGHHRTTKVKQTEPTLISYFIAYIYTDIYII